MSQHHPAVLRVYANRLGSAEEAMRFLAASPSSIPIPTELPGLAAAVDRIEWALAKRERIAVFGHDDPDGITSAAILTEVLESLGADVAPYIPDREIEGHGLYPELIHHFHGQGIEFLITTDGCSSNAAEAELARSLGLDVLVTDHHEVIGDRPAAPLLLNPKSDPVTAAKLGDLTGAGVAMLLATEILRRSGKRPEEAHRLLDLVALGTIADYGDLSRNNRAMVALGLKRVAWDERPALTAVRRALGVRAADMLDVPTCRRVAAAFAATPSIRGRSCGLDALLGRPGWEEDAAALVAGLERMADEDHAAEEAAMSGVLDLGGPDPPLVVVISNVPPRALGRGATRLLNLESRPAAVLLEREQDLIGELRAPAGVHLVEILDGLSHLLGSWGGHRVAAGFSADLSHRDEIVAGLGEAFARCVPTPRPTPAPEAELAAGEITSDFLRSLAAAAPFGKGNAVPVFRLRGYAQLGPRIDAGELALEFHETEAADTALVSILPAFEKPPELIAEA